MTIDAVQVARRQGATVKRLNQLYSFANQTPLLNGRNMAQCDWFLAVRQGVSNMAMGRKSFGGGVRSSAKGETLLLT